MNLTPSSLGSVSASSLIFFVIIAVWAATMLKHWVRRREDLVTARTVDRFSDAMRMLERRAPVTADVAAQAHEPKRAILRPQGGSRTSARTAQATPAQGATIVSTAVEAPATPVRAGRVTRGGSALTSPKVKVAALFGAFGFLVVTAVLAPFTAVPAWMPLLGLIATAGVVVWLRRSAIAERSARQVVRPVGATAPTMQPRVRGASRVESDEVAGATRVDAEPVTERSPLVAVLPERETTRETVFDQEPDAITRAESEVFDAAAWAPVEVPRPTYTMKAKAERGPVAPAATVDALPLAARYENTPVEELPFDGMALDEDYDELPQVYRAG